MPSDSPNNRLNRINYLVPFDFKTTWLNSIQTQSHTLLFLIQPEMYTYYCIDELSCLLL